MANPNQLSKLTVEGVPAWNKLQKALPRPMVADLQGADLSGKDLSEADLRGARLEGAKLRGTKFGPGTLLWDAKITKADAYQADFSGAWLDNADFTGTDLFEAKFRDANLRGADLSNTDGFLRTEQFAGADLTGTKLPDRLKKLYESLENVKGISESARKVFLALLAACLYCWLTIATTTDVNLITNRASSPLPIIQTAIPIVGFYVVAPLLVLCVYFYFHFYLQKLWEELGSLPAVFPDGRPLHTKVDPWLLNDLVRAHLPKLNVDRPFLSYLQLWISVLLAWWIVPITMFLFWGRYLRRHEQLGTSFHVVLLVMSLISAVGLYRLAVATVRGVKREPFSLKAALKSRQNHQTAAFAVVAGVLFGLVSWGAIDGVRPFTPVVGEKLALGYVTTFENAVGVRTWVPKAMMLLRYSPFANLTGAEVSQRKPISDGKGDSDRDSTVGAQLAGVDLRYAALSYAFLARANLAGADLRGAILINTDLRGATLAVANLGDAYPVGADFTHADLRCADLRHADLRDADFRDADLSSFFQGELLTSPDLRWWFGANLSGANLRSANLSGANLLRAVLGDADLTYADLRRAKNLDAGKVKDAKHWDRAFYYDEMLKALGLPTDHNEKLEEQLKKEKQPSAEQGAPNPPLLKP